MTICYEPGTTRWRKHTGNFDIRAFRPAKGWCAFAHLLDCHPITGRSFRNGSQWWLQETFEGDSK